MSSPTQLGCLAFLFLAIQVFAQTTREVPSVLPLAVRSPYLNVWMRTTAPTGNHVSSPGGTWPTSWRDRIDGWAGIIRVDGRTYQWQGMEGGTNLTETLASYLTPTRTIFTLGAGPIQFNVTYLSPVEPNDWARQSFPFTYISIDVWSTDGQDHSVQVYTDITGGGYTLTLDESSSNAGFPEILSPANQDAVARNMTETSSSLILSMTKEDKMSFTERQDIAADGTLYLAMPKSVHGQAANLTWQTHFSVPLRGLFNETGKLNDTADPSPYRQIQNGPDWAMLALSADLGTIRQTSSPFVFGVGFMREPVIKVDRIDGTVQLRSAYFWTKYTTINDAIDAFMNDFNEATTRANDLDQKLMSEGEAISSKYADLTALSLRQTFAAIDITVSRTESNALNSSDVRVYMKDIGNGGRVNAVETVFSAFPALLYLNSSLAGHILSPLLDLQDSMNYPYSYAASDLGSSYPKVNPQSTAEDSMSIENSGSMLVMALAHAKKSGDGTLIQSHYGLLRTWAEYLEQHTLSSGANGTLHSNTVLKGIAGLSAMSMINEGLQVLGAPADLTRNYENATSVFTRQWANKAIQKRHITANSDEPDSWSLLSGVYAFSLLGSSILNESIMKDQAIFYRTKALDATRYGLPYESGNSTVCKSDWAIFAAAWISDRDVRDILIDMVHTKAFDKGNVQPWPISYRATDGVLISGRASAAQGSMFALLAQSMPDQTIVFNTSIGLGSSPSRPTSSSISTSTAEGSNFGPAIAGIVVGAVVFVGIICFLLFWCFRTRRRREAENPLHPGAQVVVPPSNYMDGTSNDQSSYSYRSSRILTSVSSPTLGSTSSINVIPTPFPDARNIVLSQYPYVALPQQPERSLWWSSPRPSSVNTTPTPFTAPPRSTPQDLQPLRPISEEMLSGSQTIRSPDGQTANAQLRDEVAGLRREMALMREGQRQSEAPPSYISDAHIVPTVKAVTR